MIDSHCHLDHEPLFSNLNQVLLRSKEIGIEKILTICTTKESFKNILSIIQTDTMIYGTFGIHPHETNKNILTEEEILKVYPDIKKAKNIIKWKPKIPFKKGLKSTIKFYYEQTN